MLKLCISRRNHIPAGRFDFLGFTHVWLQSRQGKDVMRQSMAKNRFAMRLFELARCKCVNYKKEVLLNGGWRKECIGEALSGGCDVAGLFLVFLKPFVTF